jgi:POT family proton-dependent oligopeptide transporter
VLVLLASPLVRRWMHLDTLRDHDEAHAMAGEAELAEPHAAGFDSASATRRG